MEQFEKYEATVRTRRDPKYGKVRPEMDDLDGTRAVFSVGWYIEAEDRKAYAGEYAMITPQGWRVPWIASGDLFDLEKLSN